MIWLVPLLMVLRCAWRIRLHGNEALLFKGGSHPRKGRAGRSGERREVKREVFEPEAATRRSHLKEEHGVPRHQVSRNVRRQALALGDVRKGAA